MPQEPTERWLSAPERRLQRPYDFNGVANGYIVIGRFAIFYDVKELFIPYLPTFGQQTRDNKDYSLNWLILWTKLILSMYF